MADLSPLLLARIQFGFTIAFHIIFPAFTIGLASYLAVLEGAWLATKREAFRNLYLFWMKVFALAFGMGVVSGVVMSYQLGTNWSVFSDRTGSVLGPLLGYEVLTAFFLEASFLGIMLFGWRKVGPTLHFVATLFVAVGTLFSAFWILSANSWMQTPQGHTILPDGRFIAVDWIEVIFNPSFPSRFAHMVTAAYLTTAMVVLGAAAYQMLRGRDGAETRIMRRMAIGLIAVLAPLQLLIGHESGKVAHEHQPTKVAAMEGWWETGRQSTILLGWPDDAAERTHVWLETPKGWGGWVVTGDVNAELKGLKAWPRAERPPTFIPFWAFRVMVGMGLLMITVGLWGALLWARRRLDGARLFHRIALLSGPAGFVAVLAGWMTTEVGRQPYVVFGLLRTADAVSPVPAAPVAGSLLVFMVTYAIVFTAGAVYIGRLLHQGPGPHEGAPEAPEPPGNPLAMASDPAPGAHTGAGERRL
jgi:cytochrome bd ubiquinol oxidase subunit I